MPSLSRLRNGAGDARLRTPSAEHSGTYKLCAGSTSGRLSAAANGEAVGFAHHAGRCEWSGARSGPGAAPHPSGADAAADASGNTAAGRSSRRAAIAARADARPARARDSSAGHARGAAPAEAGAGKLSVPATLGACTSNRSATLEKSRAIRYGHGASGVNAPVWRRGEGDRPVFLESALLVLLGGFLGGTARYFVSGLVARCVGSAFPWGTLAVNTAGASLIGVLAGLLQAGGATAGHVLRDFLMVGFCGGFTTVSSFSLQTLDLAREGEHGAAALNIVLSAGLSLLAAALGFLAAAGAAG